VLDTDIANLDILLFLMDVFLTKVFLKIIKQLKNNSAGIGQSVLTALVSVTALT
jgi:hypothetical protein